MNKHYSRWLFGLCTPHLKTKDPTTVAVQRQQHPFRRRAASLLRAPARLFLACMMALAALLPQMAQAKVEADYFNNAYMIRDLRWDKALGCIEFKILVQDTYKDNTNEYIGGADIVISGQKIGRLTAGNVNGDDGTGIMSDTYGSFCFTPYDPLIDPSVFKNKIKDRLTIIARFRGDYKTDLYSSSTTWHDYTVVQPGYHSYGTAIGLVDESGDPEVKDRLMYAVFRYYPGGPFGGDLSNFGGISVSVENDVWIEEEAIKGSHAHLNINGSFFKQIKISNILSPVTLSEVYYFNNYRNTDNTVSVPGLTFKVNRTNYDFADDMDENLVFLEFFALNDASCTKVLRTTRAVPLPKKTSSFTLKTDTSWRFTTDEIKQGRLVRICYTNKLNESDYPAYRARFVRYSSAVTIKPFPPPTGVEVTDNGCGILKISWDVNTSSSEYASSYIHIYNGNSIIHSSDYSVGKWEYNIKEYINTDTKAFDIKLTHAPFDYTSPEALKTTVTFNKNMRYRTPSSLNTTASSGNGFRLKWNNGDGYYCNDYKYRITVTQIDSLTQQEIVYTSGLIGMDETEANITISSDIEFNLCKPTSIGMIMIDPANSDIVLSRTTEPLQHTFVNESEKSVIEEFTASKGFYPDRVELNWKVSTTNKFANYIIYRKEYGRNNVEGNGTQVAVINNSGGITSYTYEDEKAVPGTYYTYTLTGQMTCGDGILSTIGTITNIGFIQPYGTVSGRISFEGGTQAVEGVSVAAEGTGEAKNKALSFNSAQKTRIETPYKTGMLSNTAFTFQAWTLVIDTVPSKRTLHPFVDAGGKYSVELDNDAIHLGIYKGVIGDADYYIFNDFKYVRNEYRHISVSYSHTGGANGTGTAILYVNGAPVDTVTQSLQVYNFPNTTYVDNVVYFGRRWWNDNDSLPRHLNGYMDEVRLWKRTLTAGEIAENYDRYITGRENGLALYYRFDEPDGMDEVFDVSAVSASGSEFNLNHGKISGTIARTSYQVPDKLAIKTLTDEDGNYLLNTVSYTGTGNSYNIVPMLGVHQFSPNKKPLFFSNTSTTHNNIDFTDISSFDVSGTVVYEGGTYPVEGCQFKVDGRVLTTTEGMPIQSGADGQFTISVPIGIHEVKVEKSGHVFADGGRLLNSQKQNLDYNAHVSGIRFLDQTRVKLVGHVVGGLRENDKTSGFGLRVNNIGADGLPLTAVKNYLLAGSGVTPAQSDTVFYHNGGKYGEWTQKNIQGQTRQDSTRMHIDGSTVTIHVSPETGEYVAWLYPEEYTIGTIKMNGNDNIYERNEVLDLRDAPVSDEQALKYTTYTYADSVWVPAKGNQLAHYNAFEVTDTVKFHKEWGYYYQATPDYTVKQTDEDNVVDYFGNSELKLKDDEILPLVAVQAGQPPVYTFSLPVFRQGERYRFQFKAFEKYTNENKGTTDIVPVEGGIISITPAIALDEKPVEITLDETGEGYYEFLGGSPDLVNLTKQLSTTIRIGDVSFYATNLGPNGTLDAYVLGGKSTGTDFMTAASDFVEFVLHDPPGSSSYAYINEGATHTVTTTMELADGIYQEADINLLLGTDNYILAGVGLLSGGETEVVHKIGLHDEIDKKWINNNTTTTTTVFTDKFSTSPSSDYVGHGGDVFVGVGTNVLYGLTNSLVAGKKIELKEPLAVESSDSQYALGKTVDLAMGATFATRFYYTESEIEEIMIPKWRSAMENILFTSADGIDPSTLTEPAYVSKLPRDHEHFAKPNDDEAFGNAPITKDGDKLVGPSYDIYFPAGFLAKYKQTIGNTDKGTLSFTDTIAYYTQKIKDWEKLLAANEKAQLEARMEGNISFGGGVNIEKSFTLTQETTTETGFTLSAKLLVQGETGFNILGYGLEVQNKTGWVRDETNKTEEKGSEESTMGFVLQESSSLDQLTVDYGRDPIFNTYVFHTLGGRTSCPYEGQRKARYYEPEQQHILSEATMRIEAPKLAVADGAYRVQVPSTRVANFKLLLTNESETGNDGLFRLVVDETTNPDGAVLKIDGLPIGNGRSFTVPADDKGIQKTLTLEKGPNAVSYENIRILLVSECQFDLSNLAEGTFDEIFLSVEFIPTCSDAEILQPSDHWVVNTLTGDTLDVEIGGFDVNYANFDHIELQYRATSSATWNTVHSFFATQARMDAFSSEHKSLIGNFPTIKYSWDMSGGKVPDGAYEMRVYSVCKDAGVIISEFFATAISGYKDMTKPAAMGKPTPANGILNPGDELSVTFNEEIQTGLLTAENFRVYGELNARTIANPSVGLSFDGTTGVAFTELPVYANGSFTIETWFKQTPGQAGTLFEYGESDGYIRLGLNAAGQAIVTVHGSATETQTSDLSIANDATWKYIALSYDRNTGKATVYEFEGSDQKVLFFNTPATFTQQPSVQGKLFAGNTRDRADGFNGALAQLHFYSATRSQTEIASAMHTVKSGSERNLTGYWELNEGNGNIARDKARARHLTLNTDWYIYPSGYALQTGYNAYVTLPNGTFPFTVYDDFTLEFWFKGAAQTYPATLFSTEGVAIGFNAADKLVLTTTDGAVETLYSDTLLNNEWHHLALSVKRNGNASAIIDGQTAASFNANILPKFEVLYHFGAKYMAIFDPVTAPFTGFIDEIRVWSAALGSDVLELNRNHKLKGDESGLKAYYPFETWNRLANQTVEVNASLHDQLAASALSLNSYGASTTSDAVGIKDCRQLDNVTFSYVASANKIILNLPAEEEARIDKTTLTVEVAGVRDMRDNISDNILWTAYANRNTLKWETPQVELTMEKSETKSFTAAIVNMGSTGVNYLIEDVPSWLTVSTGSGTLQPLASRTLTFTVAPGINIGSYEAAIALTSTGGLREILPVRLRVTGERPDWTVDPFAYEFAMSVIGQIKIDGYFQEDEADILGAFIGNECVGVASPVYVNDRNAYYVFVSIFGNAVHVNKPVTFKLWDAGTGEVYPSVTPSVAINFSNGGIAGSSEIPVLFDAAILVEQTINLNNGWTWISTNVTNTNPTILNQVKTSLAGGIGLMFKGSSSFMQPPLWMGLSSISEKNMYMVSTSKAHTMTLTGRHANPANTPITLNPGWSWIGYVPSFSLSVKDALAGVNPQQDDQIKGQNRFASYFGNGLWVGSLTSMQPGSGYMYYSKNSAPQSFTYPSVALRSLELRIAANEQEPKWPADYTRFPSSMTITAIVLDNDVPLESDRVEVAAFSGDECRGSVMLQYVEGLAQPYLGFLMVHGEDGEKITYRVFDHATQTEYAATGPADRFHSDGIYGNPLEPAVVKTSGVTGNDWIENGLSIYPNPVKDRLFIRRDVRQLERVEVVDLGGRLILLEEDFTGEALDVSRLEKGVYVLKIVKNGQLTVHKIIKQ